MNAKWLSSTKQWKLKVIGSFLFVNHNNYVPCIEICHSSEMDAHVGMSLCKYESELERMSTMLVITSRWPPTVVDASVEGIKAHLL